jgi:hypothetical protein
METSKSLSLLPKLFNSLLFGFTIVLDEGVRVLVSNATINNISVISWLLIKVISETRHVH